ncbi:MAG: SDR family oxidoreductase [Bacteroidota bacterium]
MSKTFIIFGATGGIGSALSRQLAAQGHHLILSARSAEPLQALASELGADAKPADATQFDEVDAIIKTAAKEHDLAGVANCVGSLLLKPAHLTSLDEYRYTISQNLDSAFFVVKSASRAMYKAGGSIVLFSSAVAMTGLNNHEAIAAAKAGIAGLVRSAAATYARRGVRVNAIAPGLTRTPMTERLTSNPASEKASVSMHALGRLGEPEEVAQAAAFLLDADLSGWVTGQVIGVDGGLSMVRPS